MPSSIKIGASLVSLVLTVGCATSQRKAKTQEESDLERSAALLDWLPLEARLADLATPLDAVTRDQAVAQKIAVQDREHELEEWVVPLLNSYLPRGDKIRGRVVFDIGRAMPVEVTANGIAYIDVTAPEWKTDKDRLWTEVVSALYRCALTQALPVHLDPPDDVNAFAEHVLKRLMVDGLATYVTAQGAPLAKSSTPDAALMLRNEKAERFQKLEVIMATARTASPKELQTMWSKIVDDEPRDRLLGIAGAAMAEAIESRASRVELMESVSLGASAFYNSYNEGRPGALVSFHLPGEAVAPKEEMPLL